MGRHRSFDWDEAQRLRNQGLTYEEIATRFGVSDFAIHYALKPKLRERQLARQKERRSWLNPCIDCGAPATKVYASSTPDRNGRCRPCASVARTTEVRPDALRCSICREWKDDAEYSPTSSSPARRNRSVWCKPCATEKRRAARQNMTEDERDAIREYDRQRHARARQRAAA